VFFPIKRYFGIACVLIPVLAGVAVTNAVSQVVKQKKAKPQANPAFSRPAGEGQWETYPQPGSFVMSLARDGSGNVWAGTEGNGVWQFFPYTGTNQWKQFTTKDGLGDGCVYSVSNRQAHLCRGHWIGQTVRDEAKILWTDRSSSGCSPASFDARWDGG
jgi:hypothetical protein